MASFKEQFLTDLPGVCDLLSDQTRLHIVILLGRGEADVTSLCKELKLRQPTVSHHLGLLRMNHLVVPKRNGRQIIYSLAKYAKVSGGKLKISLPNATVTVAGW